MADLKWGIKWLLFLSSYIPLYLILIVKHWSFSFKIPDTNIAVIQSFEGLSIPIMSIVWIILTIISSGALVLVLNIRQSRGGQDLKQVDDYRSRDELITTYILVYVFPFVVLDYSILSNWIAFVIFFVVIGIIQVRSNQLFVNPVLSVFDYRIYEIDTGDSTITLVTKGDLQEPVDSVKTVELSNGVHMTV